jgi:hypothetical protein
MHRYPRVRVVLSSQNEPRGVAWFANEINRPRIRSNEYIVNIPSVFIAHARNLLSCLERNAQTLLEWESYQIIAFIHSFLAANQKGETLNSSGETKKKKRKKGQIQ